MTVELQTHIEHLFGSYRAEYFEDSYGKFFIQPPYFSKLEAARPTLLIGGRGTGKTTALRSLRFDAKGVGEAGAEFFGIYIRINKNRVYAFTQETIGSEPLLKRAFAHYLNLLLVLEMCELGNWITDHEIGEIEPERVRNVAECLCVESQTGLRGLEGAVRKSIRQLEVWVNNPEMPPPRFSMAESPVVEAASMICESFASRPRIYACIDEYENLQEFQQRILNTYIKHSEYPLVYKVGMKTKGLKTRDTLDSSDPLCSPADYSEIEISTSTTGKFLTSVALKRLGLIEDSGLLVTEPSQLFPELSISDEAVLLGASKVSGKIRRELAPFKELKGWADDLPDGKLYLVGYWHESEGAAGRDVSIVELVRDWQRNPKRWEERLGNYGYASLFWLSRGRKGARIRKHYCGLKTFTDLANGNTRFFLQLVHQALSLEVEKGRPVSSVEYKTQTEAARCVAESHLNQLDGLCERGKELKRLILAVGKVFFELTRSPIGRQPEPATFTLSGNASARARVSDLLVQGVVHLALDAFPRTKATTDTEIQDDEYRIHPILAPFFEMTHRRKRRITLGAGILERLDSEPRAAISELLANAKVSETPDNALPGQLGLYGAFYSGGYL